MDIGNFCQVCLDTNVKMYHENKHNLGAVFQDMMGAAIPKIQYGNYFCYLCAGTLYRYAKFKQKYILGQAVLKKIFQSKVTHESFQSARQQHSLETLFFSGTLIEMDESPINSVSSYGSTVHVEVPLLTDPLQEQKQKIKEEDDVVAPSTVLDVLDVTLKTIVINAKTDKSSTLNEAEACSIETSADYPQHEDQNKNDFDHEGLELIHEDTEPAIVIETDEECHTEPKKSSRKRKQKPHSMKYLLQRSRAHKFDPKCWKVVELSEEEMYEDFRQIMDSDKCKDSVYRCDLCFRRFLKEETLSRHVRVHSKTLGEHECALCRRRFRSGGKLRAHVKVHTLRYHCLLCAFVGRSTHMAIRHDNFHKGIMFKCKLCSVTFTNQSTYYTHRKTVHRSRHVCASCGGSFVSAAGLRQHAAAAHKKEEAKPPDETGQLSQSDLFCDRCQIDFKTQEAFDEHKNHSALHVDDDAQGDSQKQFKSRKKDFKCIPCNKTFSSKFGHRLYRAHMSAAHGAAPAARLVCELCGLYVSCPPEKPLSCGNCGRRFLRRNRLTFHLKLGRCAKPR